MKTKKILNIVLIGLISIMLLPLAVNAGRVPILRNISTLNVADNNNKLTVTGTTDEGVLAIAVLVYSGEDLVHMDTCSVNDSAYDCELNKTFVAGSYTVKVADYDGGDYITKDVTISAKQPDTDTNPKTFDGIILYVGIGLLSALVITGTGIYIKKKVLN